MIGRNPELLIERGLPRNRMRSGTKPRDWTFLALYTLLTLVEPLVSGLDFRRRWTGVLPIAVPVLGFILLVTGLALLGWSMVINQFFEGTVRIQADRDHRIISAGPYAYVRHPGYTGVILYTFGLALAAGTLAALIPALINAVVFVARTSFEDRTLQEELPGYREFAAQKTKSRLVPGMW
jgi:protein-S-isoprenylcysteine O-methyltransferase Ste14